MSPSFDNGWHRAGSLSLLLVADPDTAEDDDDFIPILEGDSASKPLTWGVFRLPAIAEEEEDTVNDGPSLIEVDTVPEPLSWGAFGLPSIAEEEEEEGLAVPLSGDEDEFIPVLDESDPTVVDEPVSDDTSELPSSPLDANALSSRLTSIPAEPDEREHELPTTGCEDLPETPNRSRHTSASSATPETAIATPETLFAPELRDVLEKLEDDHVVVEDMDDPVYAVIEV